MKILKIFDSQNYESSWAKFKRDSVRAIIFHDDKLAMIKSDKFSEYKFLGGGIEPDEAHLDALAREVKEEGGLDIILSSVKEYGKTINRRKGQGHNEIFEQESFYYFCDVNENKTDAKLDDGYETEYGYKLVYVTLTQAIEQNAKLLNMPEMPWVERELFVLRQLQKG